jgi:hypothetical protein
MRTTGWRVGVGALLSLGVCLHAGASRAGNDAAAGAEAKGYTPTDQACLQYKGTAVYNSYCSGFANIEIPMLTVTNLVGPWNATVYAYSNGSNSVQCQAVLQQGQNEVPDGSTAVWSSSGVGYVAKFLGSLTYNSTTAIMYFNCAIGPGAAVTAVYWQGGP